MVVRTLLSRMAPGFRLSFVTAFIFLVAGCKVAPPPAPEDGCDGQGMCIKIPAGDSCVDASECATGFCVDDVCCVQDSCPQTDPCNVTFCAAFTGVCTDRPRTCPGGGTCSNGVCPGQCMGTIGLGGEPLFFVTVGSKYGGGLTNIALGDMDGDGDLDLVLSSYQNVLHQDPRGSVGVFRNQGDGTFGPEEGWEGLWATRMLLSDMNADGALDVILVANSKAVIKVRMNDGSGGLSSDVSLSGGSTITSAFEKVVVADLNGDGYRDILLKGGTLGQVYASLNSGGTMFGPFIDTAIAPTQADDFDAADLNGDGRADLVLTSNTTSTIQVQMGNGDGSFGLPVSYSAVDAVNSVGLQDLDADGIIDVITSNGTNTVVQFNDGNGSFSIPVTYPGGSVHTADLDGDGDLDIVGSTTLFNDGNGTFVPQTMDYLPLEDASLGDLNGDGLADIVREWSSGGALQVLRNQGNGAFLRPYVQFEPKFEDAYHVVFADLNGDSLVDVATLDDSNSTVGVHLNLGNGNFSSPVDYPTSIFALTIISSADMNGDGNIDLVVSSQDHLTVHLNMGGGVFAPAVSQMCASCRTLGDFNGDDYPDVIGNGGLTVTFGQSNGLLSTTAKTSKLESSGYYVPVPADLNGDGLGDLVFRGGTNNLEVYLNDGTGGFVFEPQPDGLFWWSIEGIVVDDINGDGYTDITFSGFGDPSYTFGQVCLNNGHGVFRKGPGAPYGSSTFVDIDGDGLREWVSGMCAFGKCYASNWGRIFPVDIDGDGTPELITSSGELHKITCIP
jgi:hypothetical protein